MLNVCCILRPAFGHVQSSNGTFFFSKFKSDLLQVLYVGGHICRNELGILPDLLHCFGDLLPSWSQWIICQTFVICQSMNSRPWHDPLRKLWSTSSTSIWFIELQGIALSVLSMISMLFWDCDFSQPKAASAWAELQLNSSLYSLVFNSGRGHLILGISRKNAFALYSCLLHLD